MLILTRRVGETVMIGDDVTVTILGVKGNQVRIGFNAPKHVTIHREEVYQRIHEERLANVSQAGSGNSSLRLVEQPPESSSASGFSRPRLDSCSPRPEQTTKFSTHTHSARDRGAPGYVETVTPRRRIKLSPQTRKELLNW